MFGMMDYNIQAPHATDCLSVEDGMIDYDTQTPHRRHCWWPICWRWPLTIYVVRLRCWFGRWMFVGSTNSAKSIDDVQSVGGCNSLLR